jgi:hypothetical protein
MKPVRFIIASAVIVWSLVLPAQAQGVTDMSKLTCGQLLERGANAIESATWLSGYYNGLRKNTKLDLNQFQKNAAAVITECKNDPKRPVMQTVDAMMSRKK